MISSPCSLRSAQCAALIALATAAGISRFEPAPAKPAARPSGAEARATPAVTASSRTQFYPAAMQALAPRIAAARTTIDFSPSSLAASAPDLVAEAPVDSWPPLAPSEAPPLIFSTPVPPALSARQHSYPYAVGPPRGGNARKLRAAGNALPGDSSARRSQVSRIARVFISIFRAPLTRTADSGPQLAESHFAPSSAPRARREPARTEPAERAESGEPESSPGHVRSAPRRFVTFYITARPRAAAAIRWSAASFSS